MNKLSLILCISFLGFIICESSRVNDITSNTKYIVDMNQHIQAFYFRANVLDGKNLEFQLEVFKGELASFQLFVAGFSYYPSDEEIINSSYYVKLDSFKIEYSSEYDLYKYPFETLENINYLAFHLITTSSLSYLSVNLYSEIIIPFSLYNITYNKEYELPKSDLDKDNIMLFKLKLENHEKNLIKLKIGKETTTIDKTIEIGYAGLKDDGETLIEITENTIDKRKILIEFNKTDNNYNIYQCLVEQKENVTYLALMIAYENNCSYFSIFVGPPEEEQSPSDEDPDKKNNKDNTEKSFLSTPLIILFIVLYTVIILGVFYLILRKCGYSRNANSINIDSSAQPLTDK